MNATYLHWPVLYKSDERGEKKTEKSIDNKTGAFIHDIQLYVVLLNIF